MNMKRCVRIFIGIFLFSCIMTSLWAVSSTNQTLTTTFTAPETVFIGFSRRKVVDEIKLRPDEIFESAAIDPETNEVINGAVKFTFYPKDPVVSAKPSQRGVYYSDPFYAYCQVASRQKISVTLSVPDTMTKVPGNENLPYMMVNQASMKENLLPNTYKDWPKSGTGGQISLEFKDNKKITVDNEIRVLMCQPIYMRVDGEDLYKLVKDNNDNSVYFKLAFTINVAVI